MTLPALKRWFIHEPAPAAFLNNVSEHPLLAQTLYNRGLRTPNAVAAFLTDSDAVQANPYKLPDMAPAVARIVQAIERRETICVYGDFDADGVTATALLVSALQAAGARVGPYIPDRVDEGYGLNVDALDRIARQSTLVITVDCGIRSVLEVEHAVRLGLDVIVTDHHSVGPVPPPALAVINPRRVDSAGHFDRLAGVGVAYRLAQAVLRAVAQQPWSPIRADQVAELEELLLDLVAIGTVADMMPLLGENRTLVRRGLAQLNRTQRPGLAALMTQADLRPGMVDAMAISFRLGPRLNAAGRLSHARLAYDLLRTNDATKAYLLTTELEALNQQRRKLTAAAEAEAEQQVAAQVAQDAAIYVVSSPNFQSGIVGLVAGRLTDRFYRPALVIEEGESESRGSARSIPELDISAALDEVGELLVRHGGHSRAAGFTVATPRLPEFAEALQAVAARELSRVPDLRPTLAIDAVVALDQVNWALQKQFARLEPFGQDNPAPLLLSRGVRVREARPVGSGKHLKLVVDDGPGAPVLDAIAFQHGEWAQRLGDGSQVDLVYELGVNEWQGRRQLQLTVHDLRPPN